ncbi:hypothetical protein F5051DRAFT_502077 [Lentinula edodes]|nr:hypothetical protein F5051DRAFT_502077 [Lentinula edodes]
MTSLDLFDTPWSFFKSLACPEHNIGIPEITFDLFKQAVLPSVEESSVEKAYQKLRERGILIDEGWKELNFGVVEQEQESEEEEEEELKVEVQKKESLFYAPLFDGLNTVFPIAKGEEYECDVFMTGELKKRSTPDTVDDNNKKVLSNATHIMGADPTRRFMFGLTIDKFNVRLWFFSRSHDAKNLIYFALSLSGACREELGYDPTVRRVQGKDGTTLYLHYRRQGLHYNGSYHRSKGEISARVLNDEGDLDTEVKVIKDYWLPEDSCTELEIRLVIEANVQKVNAVPKLDRSAFNEYFVRIEACEKVPVPSTTEKGLTPDSTSNFLRGQTLPSDIKRITVSTQSSTYQRVMSVSIPASIMMESGAERQRRQETVLREATATHLARLDRRTYAPKVHCRQLSEYAGKPLDQMMDWDIILKALKSLIIVNLNYNPSSFIYAAYSDGFVHRDISAANVLVKDGNAKLIDLEYSKRVQPGIQSGTSDVKTGTEFFMSVEVMTGRYLFRPPTHKFNFERVPSFPFRVVGFHLLSPDKMAASESPPSEEQQNTRDEFFSRAFIRGKRKEFIDGDMNMNNLAVASTLPNFYSDWVWASHFAEVVKKKYCALQESLPIDFKMLFILPCTQIGSGHSFVVRQKVGQEELLIAAAPNNQLKTNHKP